MKTTTTFKFAGALASLIAVPALAFQIRSVLPGEDSSSALLIGQGFNTVTRDALGHCVNVGPLQTQSGNETGQVAEFKLIEIKSESDLRRNLHINGAASLDSFLVGHVEGRVDYVNSVRKNTNYKYLMVKTRVANQIEIGSSFEYTKSVQDLFKSGNPNANSIFLNQCGNEFVYARRTGAEFTAVVEFETKTEAEAKKFDMAVAKTSGSWRGDGFIKDELTKMTNVSSTKIHLIKFGGTGSLPAIGTLEDFIKAYPQLVQISLNGPVTLEVISKSFGGVAPIDVRPDDSQMKKMNYNVEALAQNREKAFEIENSIEYIKDNPQDFKIDPKLHDFDKMEDQINNFIDENDRISRACLTGDWNQCTIPAAHKVPAIKLPGRRM